MYFRGCFEAELLASCFKQLANNFRQRSVALPSDRHKRRAEMRPRSSLRFTVMTYFAAIDETGRPRAATTSVLNSVEPLCASSAYGRVDCGFLVPVFRRLRRLGTTPFRVWYRHRHRRAPTTIRDCGNPYSHHRAPVRNRARRRSWGAGRPAVAGAALHRRRGLATRVGA